MATPHLTDLPAKYVDLVYAAALRQTRHDPHAAADVTQAVFLIMLQKSHANRLPEEARMAGWLLKVTHFAVKQARRAEQRRANHEAQAAAQNTPAPEESAKPAEIAEALDGALLKLSAADREVLVRRYLQGHAVASVAAAVGMSENTAGHRIGRALEKLRKILARRGIVAPAVAVLAVLATESAHAAPPALLTGATALGSPSAAAAGIAKATAAMMTFAEIKIVAAAAIVVIAAGLGAGVTVTALEGQKPGKAMLPVAATNEAAKSPGLTQMVRWDVILNDAGADEARKLGTPVPTASKVYEGMTGRGADWRQLVRDNAGNVVRVSKAMAFATEWPPPGDKLEVFDFSLSNYAGIDQGERLMLLGAIEGDHDRMERLAADRVRVKIDHPKMAVGLHELTNRGWERATPGEQAIAYAGELKAGEAVAFLGTFVANSGRAYHHLVVWEVFQAAREQMNVIGRQTDAGWWCNQGLEPLQQWADAARVWTAKAAHDRSVVPAGFETKLEDGKAVRLVALIRPAKWPYCWWDARGNPVEGMNGMLRLEGDPPAGLWALVEVEGKVEEHQLREPTGKAFMPGPAADYHDWDLAEVKDDDKLEMGVVVGPWKELGRVKEGEKLHAGGVEYQITRGHAFGEKEFLVHFLRDGLLDNEDRVVPVAQDGREATETVPEMNFGPHGENRRIETQPNFFGVAFNDIVAYRIMQRKRQWVTFKGFAAKPAIEPETRVTAAAVAEAERVRDQRVQDEKLRELRVKRQGWAVVVANRNTEMGVLRMFVDAVKKGDEKAARAILIANKPEVAPTLDAAVHTLAANEAARALAVQRYGEIPVVEKLQPQGWLTDTEAELMGGEWKRTPDGVLEMHGLLVRPVNGGYSLDFDQALPPDAGEMLRQRAAKAETLKRLLQENKEMTLDALIVALQAQK